MVVLPFTSAFPGRTPAIAPIAFLLATGQSSFPDRVHIVNNLLYFILHDHLIPSAVALQLINHQIHAVDLFLDHQGIDGSGGRIFGILVQALCGIFEEGHTDVHFLVHFLTEIELHLVQDVLDLAHYLLAICCGRLDCLRDCFKLFRRVQGLLRILSLNVDPQSFHGGHLDLSPLE